MCVYVPVRVLGGLDVHVCSGDLFRFLARNDSAIISCCFLAVQHVNHSDSILASQEDSDRDRISGAERRLSPQLAPVETLILKRNPSHSEESLMPDLFDLPVRPYFRKKSRS